MGKRRVLVTVARAVQYSLAAGESRTLRLKTSAVARRLLEERRLTVRLTAGDGLSRRLSLTSA